MREMKELKELNRFSLAHGRQSKINKMDILYLTFLLCMWLENLLASAQPLGRTEIDEEEWPTVLLAINARNEEFTLPTFFAYIDDLYYPKHRISVLIHTDHNEDRTAEIIQQWAANTTNLYKSIQIRNSPSPSYYEDATTGPCQYTTKRYLQLLKNQQEALDEARNQWVDYLFQVSSGNFLTNSIVLFDLLAERKTLVAPMLQAFLDINAYSNFWAAKDEQGNFKLTPEYMEILQRKKVGSFPVPVVHSTFLIDMHDERVDNLQWYPIPEHYDGIVDNTDVVAWTMDQTNIPMHVRNKHVYGFLMVPYKETITLQERHQTFTNEFVDYSAFNIEPLLRSEFIPHTYPKQTKKGFDEIYVINLLRRTDRLGKMEVAMKELGMDFKHFPAVDGRTLTPQQVQEMGIAPMTEFRDPFLERPITLGEIGCFLSHYNIWVEMIEKELEIVMVLEDDVRFEADFNERLDQVMKEARSLIDQGFKWDLLYLGRKPLINEPEIKVEGCEHIVWARYSYWTLGYIIRLSGARQLVEGNPLSKLIPVDEYIPLKFNEHSNPDLMKLYHPRNMIGLSADPLIMYPTHYVGETGHYSDTDDTLSFQGEDISHFRAKKYADIKKKEDNENVNQNQNQNGSADIKANSDVSVENYDVPNEHQDL